jgi:hypothetical protein
LWLDTTAFLAKIYTITPNRIPTQARDESGRIFHDDSWYFPFALLHQLGRRKVMHRDRKAPERNKTEVFQIRIAGGTRVKGFVREKDIPPFPKISDYQMVWSC